MRKIKTIFLFLLIISQSAFAKKYTDQETRNDAAITAGVIPTVECEEYARLKQSGDPTLATTAEERGFMLKNNYALIRLSAPQAATHPASGIATVEGTVTYEYEINGQIIEKEQPISLSIEINTATFKDIDYVKIDGALSASLEITSVNGIALFTGISLTVSCEGDIFRFLSPATTVADVRYTAPAVRTDNSMAEGTLFVSWDNLPEAEAYELEWTFLSDQGKQKNTTLALEEIYIRDYLFRHNSSRVVTVNQGYFIPLVYESGLIVFRVRPVGKNGVNGELTEVKGTWSIAENQTSLSNVPEEYIFKFNGLEKNLNWQASISFAEEGKNKTVVSYHDGSLRNRQAVTKINTDQRAIAGETFYDHNGRPVIQTLPVPMEGEEENNLHYRPHLNVKHGQTTMKKSDYDAATPGDGCIPLAPKLSTSTGSSSYYSGEGNNFGVAGNTGQNILNKEYIPDSKKYPYTQTLYMNDNTGRVAAQSGVGDAHILGSGHETRYMYGAPLQAEISRLFGNQVGVSAHYKKNSVIDANGQVSVSYLDLDGKVIATALAGPNTTGLDDLPGEKERSISSGLLTNANNIMDSDRKGKTLTHTFAVTTEVPYTFEYDMTAGTHTVTCTGLNSPEPIKLEMAGAVDATLSLYDNCNKLIFSETSSTDALFGPSVGDQSVNITQTVPADDMKVGQYTLVKSVRLNQAKLNNYLKEYLSNDQYTCVLTDEDFLEHAYDSIDFSGCGITCEECKEKIDDLIDEMENKIPLTGAEKAILYERCEAICMENTTCLASLYNMTASMSPDGQYGKVRRTPPALGNSTDMDPNNQAENLNIDSRDFSVNNDNGDPSISADNSIVPEEFPLSIFNSGNVLKPNKFLRTGLNSYHRADWRRPIQVNVPGNTGENFKNQLIFTEDLSEATYTTTYYKDENGDTAFAYIKEVTPGVYSPAVAGNAEVILVNGQSDPKEYKVMLHQLADVRDFLRNWEEHFANYLVPYHPEFAYYVECTSRKDINEYEEKLIDLNDPTTDAEQNFLSQVTEGGITYYVPDQFIAKDPLFSASGENPVPVEYRNRFIQKIGAYQQKYGSNGLPLNPPEYYTMAQASTIMVNCPDPHALCKNDGCDNGKFKADDVEEWMAFKSLYLTERQKILRELSVRNAIEGRYYNGCIGNSAFSGSAEQQRMLTRYESVPQLDALKTYADDVCESAYPSPYQNSNLPYHLFYGWHWRSYCQYLSNMVNSEYTLMRFNAIPLYDQDQTCNIHSAALYGKNIRAFYPPVPAESPLGKNGETCYEIVTDKDGKPHSVKTECNLGLLDQGAIIGNAAEIRSYQSCGLCPVATQVQELFASLLEYQVLDTIAEGFNCFTNIPSFGVGAELMSYVNNSLNSNTLLSWEGDFSSSGMDLTGTITPSSLVGNHSLNFWLDFGNSGIPNATWSDNQKAKAIFKNLKIASIATDPSAANKFILKVYINLNRTFPEKHEDLEELLLGANDLKFIPNKHATIYRYEFDVPGTIAKADEQQEETPVDIQTCDFNPLCSTTQYPTNVLSLLNTLVYEDNTDLNDDPEVILPLKPYDLNPPTPVEILDADIYEEPVRQLLGITQTDAGGLYVQSIGEFEAAWSASVQSGELSGALTYKANSVTYTFSIRVIPEDYGQDLDNTLDFANEKIHHFANIRPYNIDMVNPGVCNSNKFYADAVVKETVDGNPNSFVFHRVVIELELAGSDTSLVKPVATMCKKIEGAQY